MRDRVRPSSSSAPFAAAAAAASRPVADWGWEGRRKAHLTCALQRARAEGCGWAYGSRMAPITPALPIPEHILSASHTLDRDLVLHGQCVWLV